jgi:hypothetical protein
MRTPLRALRRLVLPVALAAAGLAAAGCEPSEPRPIELRYMSPSYLYTVTSEPMPPHAREGILYRVLVRDRETREPIETGEGRIYSSNREEAKTWDGLRKGAEVGVYYGKLNYVTSGEWAVAIEFRRDSTRRVEKIEWMQDVLAAREPGTR